MATIRLQPARPLPASVALGLTLTVGGCVSVPAPSRPSPAAPKPPPVARPAPRLKPAPIPTRPLNVAADCSFKDPTGYRGAMKLRVANAEVRSFEARVDVPGRGVCRFALQEFRQVATLPNVALKAIASSCVVYMWEQGRRVTVAFNGCQDKCSGDSYAYLWPILTDASTGGCG